MAFIQLSQLPQVTNLDGDYIIPVISGSTTARLSVEQLKEIMKPSIVEEAVAAMFPFTGSLAISGSLKVDGNFAANSLIYSVTASSVDYSAGSNIFGNTLEDIHQFTGSIKVSEKIIGDLEGTASYALRSQDSIGLNQSINNQQDAINSLNGIVSSHQSVINVLESKLNQQQNTLENLPSVVTLQNQVVALQEKLNSQQQIIAGYQGLLAYLQTRIERLENR